MKTKLLSLVLFLFPALAAAQVSYNTITGTVTDSAGSVFANAQIMATLVTSNGSPLSGAPTTPNGQPYNGSPVRGTLDANGYFSIQLVPNGILRLPGARTAGGSQWLITISAPQDPNILVNQAAWNVNYAFTVTGDADISSQLTALATQTISYVNLKTNQSTLTGNFSGLPKNNPAFTGTLSGPTGSVTTLTTTTHNTTNENATNVNATKVTGSVNSQINVMAAPYNAKGDCSTDDTPAFTAAQTDAVAAATGNNLPSVIYLPKPPGGCYIVSDFAWQGVSFEGQSTGQPGNSPQQSGVTLKSKPGHDVFKIPDPNTVNPVKLYPGWSLRNIAFLVDNTVACGSACGHRWPGRWFDDGAMTAGSATFSTTNGDITCGDVGEQIYVSGAGASGGTLATTIQSVAPCWALGGASSWKLVTLAASASTTVTNAHTYVAVLNLQQYTVGNAGIAQDMVDGKIADWLNGGTGDSFGIGGKLENVQFRAVNSGANGVAGIFTQSQAILYGVDARNVVWYGLGYGVVQTGAELNSYYGSGTGDFEIWDHGFMQGVWAPWISYNGINNKLESIELTTSNGPQILGYENQSFDQPNGWFIHMPEFENSGTGVNAWRIDGKDHDIRQTPLVSSGAGYGFLDTIDSTCVDCAVNFDYINGFGNTVTSTDDVYASTYLNNGLNNILTGQYLVNPHNSVPLNHPWSVTLYKGSNNLAGRFTADSILDGNTGFNYNHDDLLIVPQDIVPNGAGAGQYSSIIVADSTSPTQFAINMTTNPFNNLTQLRNGSNPSGIVIGTMIPQTGAQISYAAKCAAGVTTFTFEVDISNGTNVLASQTQAVTTCTTSWQTFTVPFAWGTGFAGDFLEFRAATGSNAFQTAWVDVQPFRPSFNGIQVPQPQLAGQQFTTGPNTVVANNIPVFNSTRGDLKDSGTALSSLAPLNSPALSGTPTAPTAGACNGNSVQIATEGYVATCGVGAGTVNSGSNYAIPMYGSAPGTAVSPSNIKSDSTGNNLNVPGTVNVGATPPTACGSATGCDAFAEASVAGTPTAGQDYIRADSVTHELLMSINGGAEQVIGNPNALTGLSGDVVASGPGVGSATLQPSGIGAGTCGDATHSCQITFDAKGRGTSQASIAITGLPSSSSTWYNMVSQGGLDNTCATDVASAIGTIISGLDANYPNTLYFPPGCYKIDGGVKMNCTSTTCNGYSIIGAGRDSTLFQSACTNGYMFWYDNTTNSGDNFKGMHMSDFSYQDTSGSGACMDGILLTQTSLNVLERLKALNMKGNTYSTGTIQTSGSTVTGTGTTWTANMAHGVLQVGGIYAEVCGFTSATSLTLCDSGWPTGNVAGGTSYAIAYGGRALAFDPGNSYTQYISVHDLFVTNSMYCIFSKGVSSGGNSRISIDGKAGWCGWSGSRNANSIGVWLGKHSDTFEVSIPINNVAVGGAIDSGHANVFKDFDVENNSSVTPVTTCNGGAGSQSCIFGFYLTADATSTGYGNAITDPYVYLAGTTFRVANSNGAYNLSIKGLRSASFSNTTNYNFSGTTGCPASGSGVAATIQTWDCNHVQVSQTVN